jgi:hypothetical protein
MTSRKRLAAALLKDRERRKDKPAASRSAPRVQQEAFEPFAITRWRVVAGGEPGYLVATPMTEMRGREREDGEIRGGFKIACWCCGDEFESLGLAYCTRCLEKPAEQRRANRRPQDRRDRAEARQVPASPARNSGASPRKNDTEIIEEFPPIFGPAHFPSYLVGPASRRGRLLPPELVEAILCTVASGHLLADTKRRKLARVP